MVSPLVDMRDPPVARTESTIPVVHRILAGALTEGPAYAGWRSRGTTDWLLLNTVAGHGRFGPADGRFLPAEPGDLFLLRPGATHDYGTAPGRARWDLQFAHFHPPPDWTALLDWPEPRPGLRHLRTSGEAHRRVTEAFTRTVLLSRSGLAQAELFGLNALESALLWAATERSNGDPDQPAGTHLDPRLIGVLEEISGRLAAPHTVALLARRAGLSPSRLTYLFTSQLGMPPMRFVEQQRMRTAQQLLDLSSRSVAAVGRAVGYADPLYFSARFTRCCGESPTAYRNRRTG
jgi:AraC family transcriptional regulator of arabinose operon